MRAQKIFEVGQEVASIAGLLLVTNAFVLQVSYLGKCGREKKTIFWKQSIV